jgi:serine/threonine protein kinase
VAALDHPNIVHAYDIDQEEDLHFLVMEYVDGANLQDMVERGGPLSVERAANYIWQTALALQHAHEHGLVHRDIKPGNILVARDGVVKVLDMGLALFFQDEDEALTKKHDDGTLGTADYLSPEQSQDSHEVDIRTDIYSLGMTLYFVLTGKAPFDGLPLAQKILAQQTQAPKPVSDYRKDVPAGLLAVLEKMTAKRAEDRYALPRDLAEALAPFADMPIPAPTEAEIPRLSPAASGGQTPSSSKKSPSSHNRPSRPASNSISATAATPPSPAGNPSAIAKPSSPSMPNKWPNSLILAFVAVPLCLTAVIAATVWLFR